MNFELYKGTATCPGCLIIQADGNITERTPVLFSAFIQKNSISIGKDITVVMNSSGGSLLGGLELGRIIKRNGLDTHIGRIEIPNKGGKSLISGQCASACAYAFLGGRRRSKEADSKYGLHQVSSTSNAVISINKAIRGTQDIIAGISKYIEEMGASLNIVTVATRASAESIHWVDDTNLSLLKIINSDNLNKQEPWERQRHNIWSIWSTLPDGSQDLIILSCNKIPSRLNKRGHIKISLSQSKALPKDHSYYSDYIVLPVGVNLNGKPTNVVKNLTVYFSAGKASIHGLEIPATLIRYGLKNDAKLAVSIRYPDNFIKHFPILEHPIPMIGLNNVLKELTNSCNHLEN